MDGAAFFSYGAGQGKNKDLPGGLRQGKTAQTKEYIVQQVSDKRILQMVILQKYVFVHWVLCQICPAGAPRFRTFLQGRTGHQGKDGVLQGWAACFPRWAEWLSLVCT